MRCVVLGAGNVAWSLAPALDDAGVEVVQIWSRTVSKSEKLAARIPGSSVARKLDEIIPDADLYILAVHDDAIASIASALGYRGGLWVHTSGSVDASALSPVTDTYGVLYPLQTFSHGHLTDLETVPVYVEGNNPDTELRIECIARAISSDVKLADTPRRRKLHAAAVFACNFTNHMWAIADRLLRESGSDLSVLYPLIEETSRKAMAMPPADAQTGPARRGDLRVMQGHIEALSPDDARIYRLISNDIMKSFGHECDKL